MSDLLVAVGARQDRSAFAALFSYFGPRLKTFFMRTGTPAAGAEELVQETMLTIWRKAATFDPGKAAASTWIFTVARNLRIDQRRRERLVTAPDVDPSEEQEDAPSAEAIYLANERAALVGAALKSLSEEQATIVRLSFFSERPHAEIARELGIPLGTVKSRVRLAMARLRTLLAGAA